AHPRSARELLLPELPLVVVRTLDACWKKASASQGPRLARGSAGLPRLLRQRRVLSQHARARAAVAGGVRELRVADGLLHRARARRGLPALPPTAPGRGFGGGLPRISPGPSGAEEARGGGPGPARVVGG